MRAHHHVEQRVDPVGKERRGLEHADHRHRLAVQLHLLADERRVAAEALPPEVVGENHDGRHSRAIVARARQPAEHRGEAHDLEVVPRDEPHVEADRVVVPLQGEVPRGVLGDAAQRRDAGAEIVDLRHGEGDVRLPRAIGRLPHVEQPVAVAVGQRLQQHAADHAENRGVGADAERQRDDDHRGERRAVTQGAQRVVQVGGQVFDPRQSPPVVHRLGGLGEAAGRQQRLAARFIGGKSAPDVLGGLHVEVGLQLFAEIGVRPVSGEDSRNAEEYGAKASHGVSRFGARKAAIRSAV